MAKIPFYEDRLAPSGQGVNVSFRPVEVTDAIGRGMQNLGQAGISYATVEMGIQKKRADDQAIANEGVNIANAQAEWPNRVTQLAREAVDGGNIKQEDGSYRTLTDQLKEEWGKYRAGYLEKVTNEKAKLYVGSQLDNIWAGTLRNSIATEANLNVTNKSIKVDQATDTWAKAAASNANLADQSITAAKTMIANSGFDQETAYKLTLAATKKIAESALTGAMERNATEVAQAIRDKYGATINEANKQGATTGAATGKSLPQGDMNAITSTAERLGISAQDLRAIISYETGGTFSPAKRGGKNDKHIGLIQFGEEEQKAFGANQSQTFSEQMVAVEKYLKARGVKPGDDLKTLYKIVNGGNRNAPDTANDGNGTIADHVEKIRKEHGGSTTSIPNVPVSQTVRSLVDQVDVSRLPAFLSEANTLVNKEQTVFRGQVASTEGDHVTAWMNGEQVQKPLTEADYVKAYGPIDGAQRYANYQQIGQLGQDITALKMTPVADQQAVIDRYKPDASKPGYELATKRYDAIVQAANKLNTDRAADPMAWAQKNGLIDKQPINWNELGTNPDRISTGLSQRSGIAQSMMDRFGTPMALLSKDEAGKLAAGFNAMSAEAKLSYLSVIAKSVPAGPMQASIFNQIAKDSPVTAYAGKLFADAGTMSKTTGMIFKDTVTYDAQQVATMVIKGEALLNPTKADKDSNGRTSNLLMPPDNKLQADFQVATQGVFPNQPQAAQLVYQAAKAYYAAKSAQVSDYSGEYLGDQAKRWKEAVDVVVGGISDVNGGKVRRPWGMDETKFKDQLYSSFNKAAQAYGIQGNAKDFGRLQFEATPNDTYLVRSGSGYLQTEPGKPMVVSLDGQIIGKPSVAAIEKQLTPQEMEIVKYHRNSISTGNVGPNNETVYSVTIQIPDGPNKGKFVTVPGWYYGKTHTDENELWSAYQNEVNAGMWPIYTNAKQADARAKFIHGIMDQEVPGQANKRVPDTAPQNARPNTSQPKTK